MSSKLYSKIKYTLFTSLFVLIVAGSCVSSRQAFVPDFSKAVSYNKVRIEVSSGLVRSLAGYIYIIPDSQVCFRFWGPMGFEIGKGYITQSKFLFYSEMENVLVSDLKNRIESLSGCAVNLSVFQCLLQGNIDGFVSSLNQLNNALLDISVEKGSRKSVLTLQHKVNHSGLVVYFLYRKGNLKNIILHLSRDKNLTTVSFELSDTSYDRKKCTFAF